MSFYVVRCCICFVVALDVPFLGMCIIDDARGLFVVHSSIYTGL